MVEEVFLLYFANFRGKLAADLYPPQVETFQTLSLDPLLYVRTQTITLIFTLLRDNPEQEQNLLRLLVNKLV